MSPVIIRLITDVSLCTVFYETSVIESTKNVTFTEFPFFEGAESQQ